MRNVPPQVAQKVCRPVVVCKRVILIACSSLGVHDFGMERISANASRFVGVCWRFSMAHTHSCNTNTHTITYAHISHHFFQPYSGSICSVPVYSMLVSVVKKKCAGCGIGLEILHPYAHMVNCNFLGFFYCPRCFKWNRVFFSDATVGVRP